METYNRAFKLDTSALPPGAIKEHTQKGTPGKAETELTLNMDDEFEIAIRLLETNEPGTAGSHRHKAKADCADSH